MGLIVEYLQKHPKTGRLSYRRAFPPDLRRFIPGEPRELKRSLSASDIKEPAAMEKLAAAAAEFDRLIGRAQKAASRSFDKLDDPMIAYLAKVFERDQAIWVETGFREDGASFRDRALEGIRWMEDEFLAWRADDDLEAMEDYWGRQARALVAAETNILLDPADTDSIPRLCRALNASAIAIRHDQKARLHGEVLPVPVAPERGAAIDARGAVSKSFQEIAQDLLENERLGYGASNKQAARTALRFFSDAFGPLRPSAITRAVVSQWLDLLSKRPAAPDKEDRSLPLRAIVERYAERTEARRLSTKTIMQHLGSLAALWAKAQDEEGLISEGIPNPFRARKSLRVGAPQKVMMTPHELSAIFALPIFTKGERPKGGKGEASYWMPLLLLWTGTRPEEIAQLVVDDVQREEGTGRWTLQITDRGEHEYKGKRTLKTRKHDTGRRTFPLPQALLDLNFVAYLDYVRASGSTALFPALRPKGERNELHASFGVGGAATFAKAERSLKTLLRSAVGPLVNFETTGQHPRVQLAYRVKQSNTYKATATRRIRHRMKPMEQRSHWPVGSITSKCPTWTFRA